MFSKIFTVSFLLAFFAMSANCSQYLPYYPYNDNYLSGQGGGNGGGAQGEIQNRGAGPSINVNPVNNAESHSGSSPYTNQRTDHTQQYPY